jgi:hypothetical protein
MGISITSSAVAVEKMNLGAPVTGCLSDYRMDVANSPYVIIENERGLL